MGVMESIYLDSCLVIYFIEEHPRFCSAISKLSYLMPACVLYFATG